LGKDKAKLEIIGTAASKLTGAEGLAALAFAGVAAAVLFALDRLHAINMGPVAYANGGGCDAWHYFGLSVLPKAGAFLLPNGRMIGRPMYFGVLFGLKSLLPSIQLGLTSYLLFYSISIAALYVALRALFCRQASALACLVVALCPLFVNAMSTTYVTVAAFAYTSCMLACFTWAPFLPEWRRRLAYLVAGVFYTWAASANLIAVEYNSFFCLLVLLRRLAAPLRLTDLVRPVVSAAIQFLCGMLLGCSSVVGLASALGTGGLSPYRQIREVFEEMGKWHYSRWMDETLAFGLVALAIALSIIAFVRTRKRGDSEARDHRLIATISLLICGTTIFTTAVLGDQSLVYDWFYMLLLPVVALVLCAALEEPLRGRTLLEMAQVFTALLVAVFLVNGVIGSNRSLDRWFLAHFQIAFHVAVAFAIVSAVFLRRSSFPSVLTSVLSMSLAFQCAKGAYIASTYMTNRDLERAKAGIAQDALHFIYATISEKPAIWVSPAPSTDANFDLPIVRGMLRCNGDASETSKASAWPLAIDGALVPSKTLVVIGDDVDAFEVTLRQRGYSMETTISRTFEAGAFGGVRVTIGKALALEPSTVEN
jgi:hypothetical protein